MQTPPEEIKNPLRWLIGKWKAVSASVKYPTIKPFTYNEDLEFKAMGELMLNYTSYTEHPEKKKPMHLETGLLRIKPESNQVGLITAHNFGINTFEEGNFDEETCTLELKRYPYSRMAFASSPPVTELTRTYKFNSDTNKLELVVCLATTGTTLTEHLRISYEKC